MTPKWAEKWAQEGLFKRTRFDSIDIWPARKKRFVSNLWIRFIKDDWNKNLNDPGGGQWINPNDIRLDRKISVANKFGVIHDSKMRDIMIGMICTENPPYSARYTARKNNCNWEQFKIDFNYGLHEVMK